MSNDIFNLLAGPQGKQIIDGIAKNAGTSSEETQTVLKEALPGILGFMNQNASSPAGASSLLDALNGKHDGSILDSLGSFFGNGGNENEGNGILNHILGAKKGSFEENISQKTGVSTAQITKIIALLAPVVMGYLGKQNRSKGSSSGDIGDLLGGLLGGSGGSSTSTVAKGLGSMLDQNGDGKLGVEDIGGLLGGFLKKK